MFADGIVTGINLDATSTNGTAISSSTVEHHLQGSSKRRRMSEHQTAKIYSDYRSVNNDRRGTDKMAEISISSTTKLAEQTVAPFLAKHIPHQYAPLGTHALPEKPSHEVENTKYCYRHRPDLKCRRQADEPSMEQLQLVKIPL